MKKVIRGLVMAVIFASPLGFAGLHHYLGSERRYASIPNNRRRGA